MGRYDRPISRRRLFELGGATAGLAAVLAACGDDVSPAPGRVGNAPSTTALPRVAVDDGVYLRTLTSVEHSIIEVYGVLAGIDGVDEDVVAVLERLGEDHTTTSEAFVEATRTAGAEPYQCANDWLMRRTIQPVLDHIVGDDEEGIEPSDDPTRDALATAHALETMASSTSQQYVVKLTDPALRATVIGAGAQAARRAAAVALLITPPPEGFLSPELEGDEVVADENGFVPQYAIPARFGQLVPVELQVGAADDGVRFKINVETPADNAYVYADLTCDA